MPMANASLLDEATSAAEAMTMCTNLTKGKRDKFFVSEKCHPQTIALIKTRADAVGMTVVIGDVATAAIDNTYTGALVQYPDTEGSVVDLAAFADSVHAEGALVVAATDLMALTQLKPPGEWGADIAVGSAQVRGGVPTPHSSHVHHTFVTNSSHVHYTSSRGPIIIKFPKFCLDHLHSCCTP